MVNFKSLAFLFTLGVSNVLSQESLLSSPVELWSNQVFSSVSTEIGVGKGNGCTLSPDGAHIIVTSVGGTVTSFNSMDGQVEWEYDPPQPAGGIVRSHSQVVFANATTPYMVYAVVENENSAEAVGRVIALDLDGTELWVSGDLDGKPAGTPAVSSDGNYVFLTHNSNFETIGFFTILSAADGGAEYYSASNQTTPFSPIGIYHKPYEGYYDDDNGRNNTNDIVVWAMQPKPDDTTIGDGQMFGFQFPVSTTSGNSTLGYFLLGEEPRTFQTITAPAIANEGFNLYFSASRSNFFGWYGSPASPRGRFNRGSQAFAGFSRNLDFAGQPVFATPAVSNGVATPPAEPVIFGGTASTEFIRLNYNFSEQVVVTTSSYVKAEARVDPFDRVVYFAEEIGTIHQVDFTTIQDLWVYNASNTVEGEMALNPNGYILYVADSTGLVSALQLSNIPPTTAPTAAPTANITESEAPTAVPIIGDETPAPTPAPTAGEETPEPTAGAAVEAPTPAPAPSGSSKPMIFLSMVSMVLCLFW